MLCILVQLLVIVEPSLIKSHVAKLCSMRKNYISLLFCNKKIENITDNDANECNFGKYTQVQLCKNNIAGLPSSMFGENSVTTFVSLFHNRLTCVPNFSNLAKTLQRLSLGYNDLHKCKDDFDYHVVFISLRTVELQNCNLKYLPNIVKVAPNLELLYLSHNCFTTIPDLRLSAPKLDTLRIQGMCRSTLVWDKKLFWLMRVPIIQDIQCNELVGKIRRDCYKKNIDGNFL